MRTVGDGAGVPGDLTDESRTMSANIRYRGSDYDCWDSETVLDSLLRHGVAFNFSCRKGVCLECMMRTTAGAAPAAAQAGIDKDLRKGGYFLPCLCRPLTDLTMEPPEATKVYGRAIVVAKKRLAPHVCRVTLRPSAPLYYHAGQFILLRRIDGLARAYSLASVPALDRNLDIHVRRTPDGHMSG